MVQRPRTLVQSPAANGPASGCLWLLEGSWMSWQPTAASSDQATPGVGSIPPPAPGLQPGNVLPGKRCTSSAMRSYPCLLNGLKPSENTEIIFYFKDQNGVAHYSQPTHKMSWFSIFLHWSFCLTADLQVVMVFHKGKANKTHPISAYQKSKIILNKAVMISHAKAVSRAASAHSGCFSSSHRSLGSGEHQLDVWGAGCCPVNSCGIKNGTFQASFCSCFYISHRRYWNQRMHQVLQKLFTVTSEYGY